MITLRTVAEMRSALAPARRVEASIGLVPTMGALHDGHLSLIRRARETCDVVVVSLFVNPAQFNEGSDLADYPRDERRDAQLATEAGADYLFAPGVETVYPDGFSTTVSVDGLTATLEGAHRGRGHFDGVTTVVTKLLNMVGPDVAFFGQKDAQQALVVTKLVRDLDLPVSIEICPTVREPDGLALSSRNVRLDTAQRQRATALSRALAIAAGLIAGGERRGARRARRRRCRDRVLRPRRPPGPHIGDRYHRPRPGARRRPAGVDPADRQPSVGARARHRRLRGPTMSAAPATPSTTLGSSRQAVTLRTIMDQYGRGEPLVMITAYDYPSARAAEAAGVDLVLVGDSGAEVVLGYPSTVEVSMDEMIMLSRAARRGLRTPLMISDLPFGSYEESDTQAVRTAMRFVKEAGADAVKLERGNATSVARARAIVQAGIPVMGHVGLTPQTAVALGGLRAQGRDTSAAMRIVEEALALQAAGCFAVVLEAIPAAVSAELVPMLDIPTIGIGAGPATDGQVLVFHDLLGIREGAGAKFVRRYGDLQAAMDAGVSAYTADVRTRRFPGPENSYGIDEGVLAAFRAELGER